MVRTQIQLTEEQSRFLKRLAAERDVSVASLIREAIERLKDSKDGPDREELKRRALSVVGMFRSGKSDISVNHDKYLAEIYPEIDDE